MERRTSAGACDSAQTNLNSVVDYEIDMHRPRAAARVFKSRLERIVAWMIPAARVGGAPMRSVAREIEELLPSRDN